jgi:hypothetical protein
MAITGKVLLGALQQLLQLERLHELALHRRGRLLLLLLLQLLRQKQALQVRSISLALQPVLVSDTLSLGDFSWAKNVHAKSIFE